jgi:mlo protein
MGSNMKQSIFDDQTSKALKNWRAGVKKKAPNSKHGGPGSPSAGGGGSPTEADGGIALTQQRNTGDEDSTGLQAGTAQAAAGDSGKTAAEEYEVVKIDD